jgi:hypothetical protein
MPEIVNPLLPGPADFLFLLVPILFGVFFLVVVAGIVFVVVRLVKDRSKIAAYSDAMYQLPGEILKATQAGDLAKAQLLQNQLVLMQRQELASRRRMSPAGFPAGFPAGMPGGTMAPGGVPGDINGDGIPGN